MSKLTKFLTLAVATFSMLTSALVSSSRNQTERVNAETGDITLTYNVYKGCFGDTDSSRITYPLTSENIIFRLGSYTGNSYRTYVTGTDYAKYLESGYYQIGKDGSGCDMLQISVTGIPYLIKSINVDCYGEHHKLILTVDGDVYYDEFMPSEADKGFVGFNNGDSIGALDILFKSPNNDLAAFYVKSIVVVCSPVKKVSNGAFNIVTKNNLSTSTKYYLPSDATDGNPSAKSYSLTSDIDIDDCWKVTYDTTHTDRFTLKNNNGDYLYTRDSNVGVRVGSFNTEYDCYWKYDETSFSLVSCKLDSDGFSRYLGVKDTGAGYAWVTNQAKDNSSFNGTSTKIQFKVVTLAQAKVKARLSFRYNEVINEDVTTYELAYTEETSPKPLVNLGFGVTIPLIAYEDIFKDINLNNAEFGMAYYLNESIHHEGFESSPYYNPIYKTVNDFIKDFGARRFSEVYEDQNYQHKSLIHYKKLNFVRVDASGNPNENGNYYQFGVNIKNVPEHTWNKNLTAVVGFFDVYAEGNNYVGKPRSTSVRQLANSYINTGDYYGEEYISVLRELAGI